MKAREGDGRTGDSLHPSSSSEHWSTVRTVKPNSAVRQVEWTSPESIMSPGPSYIFSVQICYVNSVLKPLLVGFALDGPRSSSPPGKRGPGTGGTVSRTESSVPPKGSRP